MTTPRIAGAFSQFLRYSSKGAFVAVGLYGCVLFVLDKVVTKVSVEGLSMQPSINPQLANSVTASDTVLVWKWKYTPARGDIVLMLVPGSPNRYAIKRVIGIDGDIVIPRKPRATFTSNECETSLSYQHENPVRIPPGHCWVEGDNAAVSVDSNTYGAIPMGLVLGKVTHIIKRTDPRGTTKWMWTMVPRSTIPAGRLITPPNKLALN